MMSFFIITTLLVSLASSAIVNYGYITGTIPSYTYPVTLNAGDVINGTLLWPGTEDLDIYLYKSGQDLLSRGTYLDREYSGDLNP